MFIPLPARGKGVGRLSFSHRGHWLGRPSFFMTDPLGFFAFQCPINLHRYVTVPPEPAALTGGFPIGRFSTESAAAPRLKEEAEERLERRQYTPGDDPRRLDWKHYARTGEFMIRVGEDEISTRGRIWLQVASSPGHFSKRQYGNLDSSLKLVRGMVQTLAEAGQEVLTRFPGEERWVSADRDDWLERISRVEPASIGALGSPGAGETLCVVSHSEDPEGWSFHHHALSKGCQAVFFASDSLLSHPRRPGWWFFDE